MPTTYEPRVGDWYKKLGGDSFEVVAVDKDDETVEIQYCGGEVEELEHETWYELDLEPMDPPEDWSGPFDDLEADDFGDNGIAMRPDVADFLDEIDRED
mgnify:CR=1 FL=1